LRGAICRKKLSSKIIFGPGLVERGKSEGRPSAPRAIGSDEVLAPHRAPGAVGSHHLRLGARNAVPFPYRSITCLSRGITRECIGFFRYNGRWEFDRSAVRMHKGSHSETQTQRWLRRALSLGPAPPPQLANWSLPLLHRTSIPPGKNALKPFSFWHL